MKIDGKKALHALLDIGSGKKGDPIIDLANSFIRNSTKTLEMHIQEYVKERFDLVVVVTETEWGGDHDHYIHIKMCIVDILLNEKRFGVKFSSDGGVYDIRFVRCVDGKELRFNSPEDCIRSFYGGK